MGLCPKPRKLLKKLDQNFNVLYNIYMERKSILITRFIYIFTAIIIISISIWRAESIRSAALPVSLVEHHETIYIDGDNSAYNLPLKEMFDRIVYIDAGHGGIDPGVTRGGVYEKDINLAVALMVYDLLLECFSGIHPVMSRFDDSAVNRYRRAEEGSRYADMIVSIHCNSFSMAGVRGTETYFDRNQILGTNNRLVVTSMELAEIMQRNIVEISGFNDRGARNIHDFGMEFVITTAPTVPSVLVELGYMSNPDELVWLTSPHYQGLLAVGIYKGILEVFGFGAN